MDPTEIEQLYEALLVAWNKQDARAMASPFTENGNLVGFDGSQINGRSAIESHLAQIFAHHRTASYVWKIREIRFLDPNVALLRAVVGMVPPGINDLNPSVNAIQSLVTVKDGETWQIARFQNTPAQFHGRPELAEELTAELRQLLR